MEYAKKWAGFHEWLHKTELALSRERERETEEKKQSVEHGVKSATQARTTIKLRNCFMAFLFTIYYKNCLLSFWCERTFKPYYMLYKTKEEEEEKNHSNGGFVIFAAFAFLVVIKK